MQKYDELWDLMSKIYKPDYVQQRINEIDVREIVGLEFVIKVHVPTMYEIFIEPTIRKAAWVGCTIAVIQ